MAPDPGTAQRDEPVTFGLERDHSFLPLESRRHPDIEMDAVLGGLVLGDLLEEHTWAVPVRILDGRPRIALLFGNADPGEKVVPRGRRVGVRRQLDARWPGWM